MCDPQKLSILDELRSFLGYEIRPAVATEKEIVRALERYYAVGGESVETLIADMEQDEALAAAAKALEKGGPDGPDQHRGPGRQRPGAEALEHGAVAGDQGPRQRLALRALRERVQDSHPCRRGALRDGAAAAAPGLRHHHPHQGHGRPGHRRAAAAPGRPHPPGRGRPSGRPPRQRPAHHVRRERGDAGAGPLRGHARPERRGHGHGDPRSPSARSSASPTASCW